MQNITRIFICYRQVDGKETANWLYKHLQGRPLLPIDDRVESPLLEVYFDQATPAVGNWKELHRPSLEASQALLVVCTPGIFSRLSSDDWVHKEIDWWLENREAAPIIIDTTGEGERWIPPTVMRRWPNSQRLHINVRELQSSPEQEQLQNSELMIQRIIGGITASEATTRFEDLERQKILIKKQKRYLAAAALALLATVVAAMASIWFFQAAEREAKSNLAETLLQQATHAWQTGNSDFARILSAEALIYDQSQRTRDGAAFIHYFYNKNFTKAIEIFDRILKRDYIDFVNASASSHRAERYAHSLSIDSTLSNWITLTRSTGTSSEYDWVMRLGGLASRIERSIRSELRREKRNGSKLPDELISATAELAHLTYYGPTSENKAEECSSSLVSAATRLSELELKVHNRISKAAISLIDFEAKSWKDIQNRLSDNEVIVDYRKYGDRYSAWLLTHNNEPRRIDLGHVQEIDDLAADFLGWIRSTSNITRGIVVSLKETPFHRGEKLGAELRKLLWNPIQPYLPEGVDVVYIVPDSAVAAIPFAALPGSNEGTFLIDESMVFPYLTSAQDLIQSNESKSGEGILLIGDVGSDEALADLKKMLKKEEHFHSKCHVRSSFIDNLLPLPGTRQEVETIASLFATEDSAFKPDLLLGDEASEEQVRKKVTGHRILHFATHAWLDRLSMNHINPPFDSNTVDQNNLEAYLVTLDPTLRSGLHLRTTDVASGIQDGILSASEVAGLDLDGVDLVVLSGCDTAGSPSGGNGLIGLAAAFREAGAQSVVASLYAVADRETAMLMSYFYKFLKQGNSKAVALKEAMRTLKQSGVGPYYWAPFVAYGRLK